MGLELPYCLLCLRLTVMLHVSDFFLCLPSPHHISPTSPTSTYPSSSLFLFCFPKYLSSSPLLPFSLLSQLHLHTTLFLSRQPPSLFFFPTPPILPRCPFTLQFPTMPSSTSTPSPPQIHQLEQVQGTSPPVSAARGSHQGGDRAPDGLLRLPLPGRTGRAWGWGWGMDREATGQDLKGDGVEVKDGKR